MTKMSTKKELTKEIIEAEEYRIYCYHKWNINRHNKQNTENYFIAEGYVQGLRSAYVIVFGERPKYKLKGE